MQAEVITAHAEPGGETRQGEKMLSSILELEDVLAIKAVVAAKCGDLNNTWTAEEVIQLLRGWPGNWIQDTKELDAWLDPDKRTVRVGKWRSWDVAVWRLGQGWL